jgi:hypothetical protein
LSQDPNSSITIQNDCAVTKNPNDGQWLLLETILGGDFRREWQLYDERTALRHVRGMVDQMNCVIMRADDVLPDQDQHRKVLHGLEVFHFHQFDTSGAEKIGTGYWGTVFKTIWHCPKKVDMVEREDRVVAIKAMKSSDPKEREFFLREVRISTPQAMITDG